MPKRGRKEAEDQNPNKSKKRRMDNPADADQQSV